MKNYYEILQVNENASQEIIEKSYKTLVKKYHPDLQKGEITIYMEKALQEINEAYNVLSDTFLKEQYDKELLKQNQINNRNEIKFEREEYINQNEITEEQKEKKNNVGTFFGLIDVIKAIFRGGKSKGQKNKMTKTDLKAIGLTILVLLVIGLILWLLPFTHNWFEELFTENEFFKIFGRIFGK